MKERGRPKSKEEPTEVIGVRLPASLVVWLKRQAKTEDRSISSVARVIIKAAHEATLNQK